VFIVAVRMSSTVGCAVAFGDRSDELQPTWTTVIAIPSTNNATSGVDFRNRLSRLASRVALAIVLDTSDLSLIVITILFLALALRENGFSLHAVIT